MRSRNLSITVAMIAAGAMLLTNIADASGRKGSTNSKRGGKKYLAVPPGQHMPPKASYNASKKVETKQGEAGRKLATPNTSVNSPSGTLPVATPGNRPPTPSRSPDRRMSLSSQVSAWSTTANRPARKSIDSSRSYSTGSMSDTLSSRSASSRTTTSSGTSSPSVELNHVQRTPGRPDSTSVTNQSAVMSGSKKNNQEGGQ